MKRGDDLYHFFCVLYDIFVILAIITAAVASLWGVCYAIDSHGKQKITFRAFRSLYAVAPDRWRLWVYGSVDWNPIYSRRGGYFPDTIYMKTFIDHLRYLLFAHKALRIKRKQNLTQEFEKIAASWQTDIDSYRSDAAKELRAMQEKLR